MLYNITHGYKSIAVLFTLPTKKEITFPHSPTCLSDKKVRA